MKIKNLRVVGWQSILALVLTTAGCSDSLPSDILPKINNLEMRKTLVQEFDANSDGKLSPDEVMQIKEVSFGSRIGEDYGGIKYLAALETFDGNGCEMHSLDLTDNKKLKNCHLMNLDELKFIKVPQNIQNLSLLRARTLNTVNLPDMPFIQMLVVSESPVTDFSTGECSSLATLTLNDSYIGEVDLSKYPRLEELFCSNTKVEELDLSMLKNLREVRCKGVKRVILSPEQKIVGLNIAPDYKYCIDRDIEIITK